MLLKEKGISIENGREDLRQTFRRIDGVLERWRVLTHYFYPSFCPSVHCNFPIVKKKKYRLTEDEAYGSAIYDGLDAGAGTDISHKRKIP